MFGPGVQHPFHPSPAHYDDVPPQERRRGNATAAENDFSFYYPSSQPPQMSPLLGYGMPHYGGMPPQHHPGYRPTGGYYGPAPVGGGSFPPQYHPLGFPPNPPHLHQHTYVPAYDVHALLPHYEDDVDEGAEPILTQSGHKLDIEIRDDQILLSVKACFSRKGFAHSVVAFVVSAIVVNTLSTYMDYLVRLGGAGREYVGIIGGSFQFIIMISSLIVGSWTDKTRAYYSVIMFCLVMGAFGLAECGVSLDADKGNSLRIALLVVAVFVGPLQPVATELGVDVVYPLSENTVLVIQQLFANLLSAFFIEFFKAVKDVGRAAYPSNGEGEYANGEGEYERPQYTFSFYLLIVLHAAATICFATFNGRYLRLEAELEKKKNNFDKEEHRNDGQGDGTDRPFALDYGDSSAFTGRVDTMAPLESGAFGTAIPGPGGVGSFHPVYERSYQQQYPSPHDMRYHEDQPLLHGHKIV